MPDGDQSTSTSTTQPELGLLTNSSNLSSSTFTPMNESSNAKIHHVHTPSDDPQTLLITTLRSQISDLYTQVTQLNGKLVQSYDRVSDLEDSLHSTSTSLRSATTKVSELEAEKNAHLSALNTGVLVERDWVTAELTRVMEKATEESTSRGLAESAKARIESELDDLSASLFSQANGMVAEARLAKAVSEQKVERMEGMLKGAEEAVGMMQGEVQRLRKEKEVVELEAARLRVREGKGKYRQLDSDLDTLEPERRLMKVGNAGYGEFLAFVGHLRGLKVSVGKPPAMTTLLGLPFLARLMNEDSDPTIRLDLAPSLNWLSRRTVLAAIHNGNLEIVPIQTGALLGLLGQPGANSNGISLAITTNANSNPTSNTSTVCCALCGTSVFPSQHSSSSSSSNSTHNYTGLTQTQQKANSIPIPIQMPSWFKRPSTNSTSAPTPPPSPPPPPPRSQARSLAKSSLDSVDEIGNSSGSGSTNGIEHTDLPQPQAPQQVYIFRVVSAPPPTSNNINATNTPFNLSSLNLGSGAAPRGRGRAGTVSHSHQSQLSTSSYASTSSSSIYSTTSPVAPSHINIGLPSINATAGANASAGTTQTQGPVYPLCTSSYCLARLRATCSLWAYVRTGVVGGVWEEPVLNSTEMNLSGIDGVEGKVGARAIPPPVHPSISSSTTHPVPPIPPRRRGLWGTLSGLGSSLGSGTPSRPGTPTNEKAAMNLGTPEKDKGLPNVPPPPVHPSIAAANTSTAPPPPLPKRNEGRGGGRVPAPSTSISESDSKPHDEAIPDTNETQGDAGTEPEVIGKELVFTASPPSSPKPLLSPRRVPLPDSRPVTPQVESRPGTPRVHSPAPPGSRPTTPQPGIGARPPPPLPRRAVERAAKRASVPPVVEASGEKEEKKADDSKVGETENATTGNSEDKKSTEGTEEGKRGIDAETEVKAKVELVDVPALNTETIEEIKEKEEEVDLPKVESTAESAETKLESESETKAEKEDKKETEVVETEVHDNIVAPDEGATNNDEEFSSKDESLTLAQALSSSVPPAPPTWEERTWKEVVRLREVMFWARIGVEVPVEAGDA